MSLDLITTSEVPLLIKNSLCWNILSWTIDDWNNFLNHSSDNFPFRMGLQSCSMSPQWERNCKVIEMTFSDFFEIFKRQDDLKNWLYFDYKHVEQWLGGKAEKMDISWKDFGYPGKTARDSTLWIGTKGAHTPCHVDTYGCNLVAQIYGRKRWYLFPPSETDNLQPTRIPYEESSIYSHINFSCGCNDVSAIKQVYLVDLEPGDVLFVPYHWWHYVENLSSAISVNMWIPNELDDICRVEESLVKYFMSSVCKTLSTAETTHILNPNEDDLPNLEELKSLEELSWCMKQCKRKEQVENKLNNNNLINKYKLSEISTGKFIEYLKTKCNKKSDTEITENSTNVRNNMINAFCHPEVISLIRKKLLQSNYLA